MFVDAKKKTTTSSFLTGLDTCGGKSLFQTDEPRLAKLRYNGLCRLGAGFYSALESDCGREADGVEMTDYFSLLVDSLCHPLGVACCLS